MFAVSGSAAIASASSIFKNPVPSHGAKRNTACQQCRKRKLKCDSKRPCSTCVRSHSYARTHAAEGEDYPEGPDCTYGDEKEQQQQPANKVERLENRISELEELLGQMQMALQASRDIAPVASTSSTPITSTTASPFIVADASLFPSPPPQTQPYYDGLSFNQPDILSPMSTVDTSSYQDFGFSDLTGSVPRPSAADGAIVSMTLSPTNSRKAQLAAMGWPEHLPDPQITRHLVHAFFAFHMHAGRLFHGPTFLASLELPPTDPQFPFRSLLHAMCAVGSLYTADIPQAPIQPRSQYPQNGQYFAVDELFPGRWRQYERRPDSFAEQQAKLARISGEHAVDRGEHLIECLQTQILLTWFYLFQARWSESYISSGHVLRCVVPCGMNMAPPFHNNVSALSLCLEKPPSMARDTSTVIEEEARRNTFWIAYALERQQAAGNSFAMVLDDADVCQLLPLRGDQYEQGVSVPREERQWSHDRKIFLYHPPKQTDSFILFVKSTILLSHVKNYNLRYRSRYFIGDAAMYSQSNAATNQLETFDPRDTPAFAELDHIVASFRGSFPSHLRNPVQDEMLDAYLYTASCAAHLAQILLHEPHARMGAAQDASAHTVVKAARAILELMYAISATSYDLALLDHLPILAWNCCGRVLVKALKAAVDSNNFEQSMILQAEIAYVHSMLAKAGERMPLAYRYKKMVYDFLANHCGRQFVAPLPETSYRQARYPSPPDSAYDGGAAYANGLYTAYGAPAAGAAQGRRGSL